MTVPDETIMEDFIFGVIEADVNQRLAQEQARWSGLRHQYAITPLDPAPDEPVTATVFAGPDVHLDNVTLYFTTDGSDPAGQRGKAINGTAIQLRFAVVRWEALIWDYVAVWQGEIPGQPENTLVHYRIEGWRASDEHISVWSREMNLDRSPELPTRYGYHVDRLTPPAWAKEAVIYQVFIDRFADAGNPPPTGGPGPQANAQRLPQRWLEPHELNDFAGGTLRGVIEWLDYIVGLGVTTLWLSPIFRTPSYHGYDTSDYYEIDPRFGNKEDLQELVRLAHASGLRVILDFAANHTSTDFAPFVQAQADPGSPYRAWFHFDTSYTHGYRAFFNVAGMPQLNTDNLDVRQFLMDAACHWLTAYDIDGYRLDYAAGPSHAFWSAFRAACRRAKPDCWLFGEVTLAGDALASYAGRLDGCLDFTLCRLLRQLCAGPQPTVALSEFANAIERSRRFFPADFLLPGFLDNHDMNRFLWVAGNDQQHLRLAAMLLFVLGGPPVLYYGTEAGLSQPRSKGPWREEARHPMLWGQAQDQDLLAYFQTLIRLRRSHPAMMHGEVKTHYLDDDRGIWLVERNHRHDEVLLVVNIGRSAQVVALPPGAWQTADGAVITGQLAAPAKEASILFRPS